MKPGSRNIQVIEPREIAMLTGAAKALAEAKDLGEVKRIRDTAVAVKHYAKAAKLGHEAQNHAAEIKLRAERKAGEMLAGMEKQAGSRGTGKKVEYPKATPLSEIGIDKKSSSKWQTVAKVPAREFEKHVSETKSSKRELTTSGVLKLAKKIQAQTIEPDTMSSGPHSGVIVNDLKTLISGGELFSTVYADPPWQYGNQATRASTDNHYPTMTLDDICDLPVSKVVDEHAHLHLWTTNGFLFDAKRVMEAWGFEYRSCFVWVKPQMGIGNYWRVSHEFMLFGLRGKCPFRRRDQMSWREMDRGRHSSKPDDIRQIVESVSPGPYLEMFGRIAMPNWTVFGNQVERSIFNA